MSAAAMTMQCPKCGSVANHEVSYTDPAFYASGRKAFFELPGYSMDWNGGR